MNFFIKIAQILLPVVLVAWCAVLLAQKIDLPVADIGRHIKNGEIIVHAPWAEKRQLLHQNFYSYAEPNHPFVNHHWLSGVVFYFVHQTAGFKGLSVFYIAMVTGVFYLFFRIAQKISGAAIASILAVLVLPIIASRAEVRPEGFTYLLMGIYYWALSGWVKRDEWGRWDKRVFLLPILMLLWVNLHIGFIFGFLILGAFWLEASIKVWSRNSGSRLKGRDDKLRGLTIIGILCIIAGLVNPFFIKGLLYPLNIFRQYGYLIVENQSVMFLEKLGMGSGLYFGLFKFLLGLAALSFIIRLIRQRMNWRAFPFQDFLLLGSAGVLAVLATRNFPVFGLLFLPITAANIKNILPEAKHLAYKFLPVLIAVAVLLAGSFRFWEGYKYKQSNFGIGLMPSVERAAGFFKANKVKGPVFNNYDIGGYLIYYLFKGSDGINGIKGHKVFTDNRPEGYSVNHFQKEYIPAQQDHIKWKELDVKYNFNAIFFSHRDLTPWGQAFLISRVQDSEWAPVFVDNYNIIFVKNNPENSELIRKFLLPPEMFRVVPNQKLENRN